MGASESEGDAGWPEAQDLAGCCNEHRVWEEARVDPRAAAHEPPVLACKRPTSVPAIVPRIPGIHKKKSHKHH